MRRFIYNPLTDELDYVIDDSADISALTTRVDTLEDLTFKIAYYEEITSVSGTITIPTGATILQDQWPGGTDAETCAIPGGTGTPPDFEATENTATLDVGGNYTVSSLVSNPAALIFYVSIKLKDFGNLDISKVIEYAELKSDIEELKRYTLLIA